MKIIAVGDMHIKCRYLDLLRRARDSLCEEVRRCNPQYVVLLGDQLDGHDVIDLSCLYALTKMLKDLTALTRVIMLVGNHDMLNNRQYCTAEHALCSLEHMTGLTIVDRPTLVNPERVIAKEEPALICCPFIPKGRLCEALDQYLPDSCTRWRELSESCVIFAHQELKGVVMNCITSSSGDVYDSSWPTIVSGHIHENQKIGTNIYYVGTPWATNFTAEDGKSVSLMDFGDEPSTSSTFDVRKLELKGVPKRVKIVCTLDTLKDLELDPTAMHKLYILGTSRELHLARSLLEKRKKECPPLKRCIIVFERSDAPSSSPDGMGKDGTNDAGRPDEDMHATIARVSTNLSGLTMKRMTQLIDMHVDKVPLHMALEAHLSSID